MHETNNACAATSRPVTALPWVAALVERIARRLVAPVAVAALLAVGGVAQAGGADPDLPGNAAVSETIKAGALVIPMDNVKQGTPAPFNLKAYGLVMKLLWNGIPVKWAIKDGKAKDGIDFSANASKVLPGIVAAANLDFSGGPFVVTEDYAIAAKALATTFGGSVAVYQTTRRPRTSPSTSATRCGRSRSPKSATRRRRSIPRSWRWRAFPVPSAATRRIRRSPRASARPAPPATG